MMNPYIGHTSQLYGVEEHRLVGGKGDGMRLFEVKNGKGLEFTVSADRCADICRLSYCGVNMGYFSPCGYVAPAYYDRENSGFLRSFTAGFLTTCGLTAVGSPCIDDGEVLPLHGTISNTPAERIWWVETPDYLEIHAQVSDESIFAHKLVLNRRILCSLVENRIIIQDQILNRGDTISPAMILYHINIGYPLLSESARLYIPSQRISPRNEHAAKDLERWNIISAPQDCFEEQCYYHCFDSDGLAAIYNPTVDHGLTIQFDANTLRYFTQWKMMGKRDYVLGLEPGNCHPDGRDKMRAEGALTLLAPGESVTYEVQISMFSGIDAWNSIFNAR